MPGQRCKIDGREIHSTLKNEPGFEVAVSELPNEKTASFSDNMRTKLVTLTLEGVNSDREPGAFENATDAQAMHVFLSDLQQNPRPVRIETPRTVYDAMVMRSYLPKSESKYATALHFTTTWVEYRTVDLQKTTIQVTQRKEVKRGAKDPLKPKPPVRSLGVGAANTVDKATGGPGLTPGAYNVPKGVARTGG